MHVAIPVAIIGAISLSARRSIIIKNQAVLEQVGSCTTLIFDKTGTLTYGRPALTEVVCAEGVAESDVLRAAASLEHPLLLAVIGGSVQVVHVHPSARVKRRSPCSTVGRVVRFP